MFSAILLVAVIGANQQQEPLFPRLFPNPTGNNALEYYVRAYDIATERGLELWRLEGVADESFFGRLAFEERMSREIGPLLNTVRAGNRVPLRLQGAAVPIEALGVAKHVAKLLTQHARVLFANGAPDDATEVLLSVMAMSDHLRQGGGLTQLYVARALDAIALSGFSLSYMSLSKRGAESILRQVSLGKGDGAIQYWLREIDIVDAETGQTASPGLSLISTYKAVLPDGSDLVPEWTAQWSAIAQQSVGDLEVLFSLPEHEWIAAKSRLLKVSLAASTDVEIVRISGADPATLVEVTTILRAQRRLLRVHALIARFRSETGIIPETLEALPEEAQFDPTSGQPYLYRKHTASAYELESLGNAWHGRIGLIKYGYDMPRIQTGPP